MEEEGQHHTESLGVHMVTMAKKSILPSYYNIELHSFLQGHCKISGHASPRECTYLSSFITGNGGRVETASPL